MDPINRPGIGSVGVIGASPNASGASITGNVLTLQPASASFGGVLTSGTQTIAGAKTFTDAQTMSSALTLASGTVDLTIGNGTGNPRIIFNYAGGATPSFSFRNNNIDRWLNYITNAETGSDSGSDLVLGRAFTDAGAGIDNIITMTRAAGTAVALSRPLNMASSTASTSTTTGALVVTGGVGVGGRLNVGGALEVSSATLIKSNTTLTDGAAAAVGTLTNAPTAGNPTKWVLINDNGTIRKFPTWT